ncbi:la ribonucleoprotein domain family member 6 S homeolog isoform X2 [Xenopus laevis]|uniref:La ribonucleoprotein domain family member 6 S homeolog isoform X2 n=1 Tax=Xenopus laevis TaxID=8355 RepID=A0A8J0UTS9_XENLA|nr:la ribonucleoprotein domain family member 6 S homeolog isoform X2 [Xenopus laevis]
MFHLINAFFRCFFNFLPIPVPDFFWLEHGYEDVRISYPCGRKRHLHCVRHDGKEIRGQETILKPLAVPASTFWRWAVMRFWSVCQAGNWHLCSPFMLQTLQKSLGFSKPNKMEATRQPNVKLLASEDWHNIQLDSPSLELPSSLPSLCGKNQTSVLEAGPKEERESSILVPANPIDVCEQISRMVSKSLGSSRTEFDQILEESLLTVLEGGENSSALYLVDECQSDEDINILCGYLGGLMPALMAESCQLAEGNRWVPLQLTDKLESFPMEWPNLDLAERMPLQIDLGFGTFPGIECYGIGNHLGQIIINPESAENEDQEKGLMEAEDYSEEDFARQDKCSGAATSGGENDGDELDQDWKPPDAELIQKLIMQIEYYLSDENLEKDAFLLKHVRRNKMGFVSVKLLTSFKKVKHLTRDWRTTAYALRYSNLLELNEDNRKIRRKTPVPVFPSENLPSKMLLVYDLHFIPELNCLGKEQENGGMQEKIMEHLLKSFGAFGVISSIRILKPGRDLPSDVKRFSSRYSQVGTKDCAIVEFEEVEAAIKAHDTFNVESDTEDGLKVVLIGMKPPKKKIQKDKSKEEDSKNVRKNKSLNKRVEELQYIGDESTVYSSSEPESNPTSPMVGRKIQSTNKLSPSAYPNNHLSPNASPRNSPWSSPCGQRKGVKHSPFADSMSPEISRKEYSSDSSITPSSSPWVQRRRQAQTVKQEKSPAASPMLGRKIQNADGLPPGVLRLPRGPDGTKGFHNGGEKNKPVQCL